MGTQVSYYKKRVYGRLDNFSYFINFYTNIIYVRNHKLQFLIHLSSHPTFLVLYRVCGINSTMFLHSYPFGKTRRWLTSSTHVWLVTCTNVPSSIFTVWPRVWHMHGDFGSRQRGTTRRSVSVELSATIVVFLATIVVLSLTTVVLLLMVTTMFFWSVGFRSDSIFPTKRYLHRLVTSFVVSSIALARMRGLPSDIVVSDMTINRNVIWYPD